MITQSMLVQITFWWSATTMVGCGVVVPRQRVIAPDNGGGGGGDDGATTGATTVATTSEASVHLLTANGFPPPALLFVDPRKNWTLSDFQKPGRLTTAYSVTDETNYEDGADYVDDSETATAVAAVVPPPPPPPPPLEPEATTAVDDGQRLAGDGGTATTAIATDRGHDDDDDDVKATTALTASPAAAVPSETPTTAVLAETPAQAAKDAAATEASGPSTDHHSPPTDHHSPPPPRPAHVHVHNDRPAGWPVRQTVAAYYLHRGRYPVAVVGRPHQTIALSFRPVRAPLPSTGFRFPDVDRRTAAGNTRRFR